MLISTGAQNASLDNDYGATKGPNAAANLEVALYDGDPSIDGAELTSTGGYVATSFANDGTTWPTAATAGSKTTAVLSLFTSTAALSDTASWFVLRDPLTGDLWDAGALTEEVNVTGAGVAVSVQLTVYYENI